MKAIIDIIDHPDWMVRGWQIKFLLSDKVIHQVRLLSRVDNWYEDPVIADTWMNKMSICVNSIQQFYDTFGLLPQVNDRLSDEDTGLMVQDRSIDGRLKTIIYTLSI